MPEQATNGTQYAVIESCTFGYADLIVGLERTNEGWHLIVFDEDGADLHEENLTRDFHRETALDWALYRCRNIAQFTWREGQ